MNFFEWLKSLFMPKVVQPPQPTIEFSNPPKNPSKPGPPVMVSDTPWMDFLLARLGMNENNPDDDVKLAVFWKYCKNWHATTCKGLINAWCSMIENAAMIESGYEGSWDAGADSWDGMGTKVLPNYLQYGDGCLIRHPKGGHHITNFVRWVDRSKMIGEFLGGNQSDSICKAIYNVSGNDSGNDELQYCFRPRKVKS